MFKIYRVVIDCNLVCSSKFIVADSIESVYTDVSLECFEILKVEAVTSKMNYFGSSENLEELISMFSSYGFGDVESKFLATCVYQAKLFG